MPLTDIACRNAKCPINAKRVRLTDSGGLYLEVTPSGGKFWRWKYRFGGKEKRLAFGPYPEVTLSQARDARDEARKLLRLYIDPGAAKKDLKLEAKRKAKQVFKEIAVQWHEHWGGAKSPRHANYVIRRLEADIFPHLGHKHIGSITAHQLLTVIKKIEARGALDIAKRSWQTCGQIFRYAVAHGIIERNPTADVRPADALKPRKKTHYARIEGRELPELLRKIEAYAGTPVTRLAIKLMALTFVRTGELIAARWEEFDLQRAEWRIPAERMKMRRPHIVPLSKQALETLAAIQHLRGRGDLLFPGERDHEKPMSNNTILGALKRMGYAGRMTGHGFRGLASTELHELGFRHDIIEIQLAHDEQNQVSAAYNFASYLKQRTEMMQFWADHLDSSRRSATPLE